MKSRSLFLLLIFTAQNSFAIYPFGHEANDNEITVEIEKLNIVGPHPKLISTILKSLKNGEISERNTLLLYGPPGTGKTRYAEEIARAADCNFIELSGSEIMGKYVSDGSNNILDIFNQAYHGGTRCPNFDNYKPTILFIDEVDAFANHGGANATEYYNTCVTFWRCLDKAKKRGQIFIIMATNNKNRLPEQILNRLGKNIIKIDFPNHQKIMRLFRLYLNDYPDLHTHINYFAHKCKNLSIRTIENICLDAIEFSKVENIQLNKKIIMCNIKTTKDLDKQSWIAKLQLSPELRTQLDDIIKIGTVGAMAAGTALTIYRIINNDYLD